MTYRCLAALLLLPVLSATLHAQERSVLVKLTPQERQLIDLTNQVRRQARLPLLKVHPYIMRSARDHTRNMARQGRLSHVLDGLGPGQRLAAAGYRWFHMAENVATSYGEDPRQILNQWLQSPGHRSNILDARAREIGVAIARSPTGEVYATAMFAATH